MNTPLEFSEDELATLESLEKAELLSDKLSRENEYITALRKAAPRLIDEIRHLRRSLQHEYAIRCECVFEENGTTLQQFGDGSGPMECQQHKAQRERVAALEAALCPMCASGEKRQDIHNGRPTDYHGYAYRPCRLASLEKR